MVSGNGVCIPGTEPLELIQSDCPCRPEYPYLHGKSSTRIAILPYDKSVQDNKRTSVYSQISIYVQALLSYKERDGSLERKNAVDRSEAAQLDMDRKRGEKQLNFGGVSVHGVARGSVFSLL
jgi:hypothetical protein